ncbi:hypothetical protein BDP27DRAFT_1324801 [Rhodocollybia butyracea]|uniref:AAA+ ATPase domain-containing protein n=1 Tax=Rhodocollybia butyracea TaxID=206335 RepID=A0A9P5U8D5_9AGAR|nr:hypothetical protein BDP27DRAFT_1324801 [Rhodocollybia butyracea]
MRSQNVLRRSSAFARTRSSISSHSSLLPRPPKNPASKRFVPNSDVKRFISSDNNPQRVPAASSESETPPDDPFVTSASSPENPPDDPDKSKAKRATRVSSGSKEHEVELPPGLHVLWSPDELPPEPLNPGSVPPPEIMQEVLHNLLVVLHPQTQHRAAYPPPLASSVEPTLALYCPIEGGDYIIDSTVVELARKTGSEVLVLDGAQLAAGEWGYFGPAANSLTLPRNPLHFRDRSSTTTNSSKPTSESAYAEEDDEPEYPSPQQMMLTVLAPRLGRSSTTTTVIKPKRPSPPSKVKVFFDSLVNLPSNPPSLGTSRPRLVYIRDFPTLASNSSSWYPYLRDAVSQRRKGPLARSTSPVSNPMTIIFGMSPPLFPPPEHPIHPGGSGILSLLLNRSPSAMYQPPSPRSDKTDWSENPAAEQAREKRLQQRLRSWEKGQNIAQDEYDQYSEDPSRQKSEIILVENPARPSFSSPGSSSEADGPTSPTFYRTSVLVPSVRSTTDERDHRVLRRREINELTMRMAIGAIGGKLEEDGLFSGPSFAELPLESNIFTSTTTPDSTSEEAKNTVDPVEKTKPSTSESDALAEETPTSDQKSPPRMWDEPKMWEGWGSQLESWSTVRQIADRAIGSVVASREAGKRPTLERTNVSWADVHYAWRAFHGALESRKTWLKESVPSSPRKADKEEVDANLKQAEFDEVVERVKNDPDLDQHEQRLLPSIVDAASMPTSFSQVHLPPHTIDSIRSIVSLPLLHPQAFQTGILKQHGMTGCLLFGPPGTGKTLVVRALAKEAGCRMMAISPSDVMDMYVGEGEKLVHAVFSLARKIAPCVIFLDEIDALFSARTSSRDSGSSFAHRGIITEFMQEMDGLKTSRDDNVIVIGATNRPFDLDDAVLRRLPRRLLVDLPGVTERQEILKILLRDEVLGEDIDLDVLAKQTESFSGSDLKHLCVSAALDAIKEDIKLPWLVSSSEQNTSDTTAPEDKGTDAQAVEAGLEDLKTSSKLVEGQQSEPAASSSTPEPEGEAATLPPHARILSRRHFDKALKEITPSSSESLGSLADLRKWNEEFGEGRKNRKRKSIWGRGRFGFTDKDVLSGEEGRVVVAPSSGDTSSGV